MKVRNKNPAYSVGYGRPPLHSRFKKGQSGNPAGRRRETHTIRAQQLVRQELFRRVTAKENGKVVRMTALQAIYRRLFLLAVQGNISAIKEMQKILCLIERHDSEQNRPMSHEDWIELLDEEERLNELQQRESSEDP